MATIILQAAGAFVGSFLGPVGSAIGSAVGSMSGYMLDRSLINSTVHHKGPRLGSMRPFTAEEGGGIPRVYGTMRVGGAVIWATRFEERKQSRRTGVKGGPKITNYKYSGNAAFALCEGPIAGVRRIWADGKEIDRTLVDIRIHTGTVNQMPDELINAKQGTGNTPAYRGVAYAVIDHLPLEEFGNRLPQLQFEVLRPVGDFASRLTAVTLIPGATEQGLSTGRIGANLDRGATKTVNRNVLFGESDLEASLDELAMLCPKLEHVALVASWFGDDLRAGVCKVYPAVIDNTYSGLTAGGWNVSGLNAPSARQVSRHAGAAAYGGTPSDASVVAAIAAIKARGWKVTFYPFVMMDVPAGNQLPDPYGGIAQAAYPWRGRITSFPGPGQAGSADKTWAARSQIDLFCGGAQATDFTIGDEVVTYAGDPDDWGYRRMVLHYAALTKAAGGVDAFLIGSELRGLTTLRDESDAFPFVEQLAALASDARAIVGPSTKLTYGADWSEYFGHQPADGSGDVFFHLDPVWASPAIDAVGIDYYMPLSDWRDEDYAGGNPDGFASPYDRKALRSAIFSGEGFDWHYTSAEDRRGRTRSPIVDGLGGKHWVYRYKDLRGWWENAHYNRPGGVEAPAPTGWVPQSKPIWFTELGCPAVDKGPNRPNVFPDSKSSENALPYFSNGGRCDLAQRRLLEAHFDHWDDESEEFDAAANPLSPHYGGRMGDARRIYAWAWDARPYPAFPLNRDEWADGDNWLFGHWLNGRVDEVAICDLTRAILRDYGVTDAETGGVDGMLAGYAVAEPGSARGALSPLIQLFDLVATERDGRLTLATAGTQSGPVISINDPVAAQGERAAIESFREPDQSLPTEVTIRFVDPLSDYQAGAARSADTSTAIVNSSLLDLPGAMEAGQADALAIDLLRRVRTGRDTVRFAVAGADRRPQPGSVVRLPINGGADYVVTAVEEGLFRSIEAKRQFRIAPAADRARLPASTDATASEAGKPLVLFLDLPTIGGAGAQDGLMVAAFAKPWRTQATFASPAASGFAPRTSLTAPAFTGEIVEVFGLGAEGRIDRAGRVDVRLDSGELSSIAELQMLNGANVAAMRANNGGWELFQFASAEEIAPSVWRLTNLLRGQMGTNDAMTAGIANGADFVLLDEAVRPAGLTSAEIGLPLYWKVGPAGHDLTDQFFASSQHAGGVRSLLPLSPVHLRASVQMDGAIVVSWVRRSRVDADSWMGTDVPLGEEAERYLVRAGLPGDPPKRLIETIEPQWTYTETQQSADFASLPDTLEISVRQISNAVGEGLPATLSLTLNP
jgi:hypothetical protein